MAETSGELDENEGRPGSAAWCSSPRGRASTGSRSSTCTAASRRSSRPFRPSPREFERHGLRVIEPITGLSWWTDRLWPAFDPTITAEAYVLGPVVPYVAERWDARPPQIALLGVSMGGQAALRMAYKYPNIFPTVAAISPAIDFQKRIDEGIDPGLDEMYRDAEDARQDTATLHIHPLNWPRNQFFCCDPTDYALARIGGPAADETLVARRAVRVRPGNDRRRAQLRVRGAHGAAGDRLYRRAAGARAAPRRVMRTVRSTMPGYSNPLRPNRAMKSTPAP